MSGFGILCCNGSSATSTEFLLGNDPVTNAIYSNTIDGIVLTQEKWMASISLFKIKVIDYSYTGLKLTTEVIKVYEDDGVTIAGQLTLTFTYTGLSLTGGTITRDV